MAEPASTTATISLYSIFVALFGLAAGEYALIVFASLGGALWSVGRSSATTKSAAAWLLLKLVFSAVILTGGAAAIIEAKFGWPVKQILAPVAFAIGFGGEMWHSMFKSWLNKLTSFISK